MCHDLIVVLSVIEKLTVTKYYSQSVPSDTEQNSVVIASKAKKLWCLAYTLVRNPDLIELRRRGDHKISETDPTKDIVHSNPAYDDGVELGIPSENDDASKL